ncbi:acyl-CoA dehydrogenase family protein [Nocardioides convexus]|uniref:acyl-CoA dehydrogenase family protein n=1 Tax=Nocardioides convexus TaxID=2712224 RepID=UPI002418567C|nr:acyl-CoA dehydrogenase family protein [Nocardioides convexus]
MVSLGVSIGLGAATILQKGTLEQKERYVERIATLEHIAAWSITEPDSGSDAFGGMKTTVRRDGDEFVLTGSKTFATNGPDADVAVVYAKARRGRRHADPRPAGARLHPREGRCGLHPGQAVQEDGPDVLADRRVCSSTTSGSAWTGCSGASAPSTGATAPTTAARAPAVAS